MQRIVSVWACLILLVCAVSATAYAQDATTQANVAESDLASGEQAADPDNGKYVQRFEAGSIDWQSAQASAVGVGSPPRAASSQGQARAMAVRAATVVARRNLLEIIKGVQIDSRTSIENYMLADDTVVSTVRGYLQNSQVYDVAYMSDGSVEVTVGIGLRGKLSEAVIPKSTPFGVAGQSGYGAEPPVTDGAASAGIEPDQAMIEAAVAETYTGLLVDATGLAVRPALTPRILDQAGNEIYGSASVSREYAVSQGMAGYARSFQAAVDDPRVSGNPLLVKAVSVSGPAGADLVLDDQQAALVRAVAAKQTFLRQCRVMIVLD